MHSFEDKQNLTQLCFFGRAQPNYTDFITTEPPSIVSLQVPDIQTSPDNVALCNHSPRVQNSPTESLSHVSGQSAGPSGSPMSFKEISAVRPIEFNGQIEGPDVGNKQETLLNFRSGGQHSITGGQLKRTKFKPNLKCKFDRQQVQKPNQKGQNFRVLPIQRTENCNAKASKIIQNLELIDLEHKVAQFDQQIENQTIVANVKTTQIYDDIYQFESKDLPEFHDGSYGGSLPQTWAQNVPTDENKQEFVSLNLRQKEPATFEEIATEVFDQIMIKENEIKLNAQNLQKPQAMESTSQASEEMQEDGAYLTDESHDSRHEMKTETSRMIQEFRSYSENIKASGYLYCCQLKEIQETLQSRELIDACRRYGAERPAEQAGQVPTTVTDDPLEGHMISSECRTMMTDWMIEVCSGFKCQPRTYFLAVTIFDKYLIACRRHGIVQQDADVLLLGVTAIYLASKYEDVRHLHANVVAEKIAHGAIEAKQIVAKELEFLRMFEFQMEFATPFDFWQTYSDKIEKQTMHNLKFGNCGDISADRAKLLLQKLSDQCLLMVRMAMQCRDFMQYSGSSLVVAAFYASTAFLKHSQLFAGNQTNDFMREVRRIIFQIMDEEKRQTEVFLPNVHFRPDEIELLQERKELYQRQFNTMFVEQVAMDLVDYFKMFDSWHCGKNLLKKFHNLPLN